MVLTISGALRMKEMSDACSSRLESQSGKKGIRIPAPR